MRAGVRVRVVIHVAPRVCSVCVRPPASFSLDSLLRDCVPPPPAPPLSYSRRKKRHEYSSGSCLSLRLTLRAGILSLCSYALPVPRNEGSGTLSGAMDGTTSIPPYLV